MMDMTAYDSAGAPWLDQPVMLQSSRMEDYNKLTPPQYAFVTSYWVYWYQADNRYGLPTIAFFLAVIGLFGIAALFTRFGLRSVHRSNAYRRLVAVCRWLSYKGWHVKPLHWYSPPLGMMVVGGLGAVYFLSMTLGPQPYYWPNTKTVSYGNSPPIATRAGFMSIACLPFVLMLGSKENPISWVTRIPHDQLMIFHRWVAWAMFVLALVHTFPFVIFHTLKGDVTKQWKTEVFWWSGVVAILAQAWLQFMSIAWIRNKFYETFKALHLVMAALFFAMLFIHCDFRLTSWEYLIAAAVLYALCLVASQLRTWAEYGVGTMATLEPAASGSVRVTIPTTSPWAPGQHIFVRFRCAGLHTLTAHPFSICSLPRKTDELLRDVRHQTAEMVMYIQPKGGFTARLAAMAAQQPGRKVRVLLDGPYGGMNDRGLDGFDKAVIIAGGSGAGFTLPIVENVLLGRKAAEKAQGPKTKLHIVLAVKTEAERRWYEDALREMLLRSGPLECCCSASIYVTGSSRAPSPSSPASTAVASHNDSERSSNVGADKEAAAAAAAAAAANNANREVLDDVHVFRGSRPDLLEQINDAVEEMRGQRLGIAVCGPRSMLFDVRKAASQAQLPIIKGQAGEVYLYSEHFGW